MQMMLQSGMQWAKELCRQQMEKQLSLIIRSHAIQVLLHGFINKAWLAFNMFQNGHCRDNDVYDKIQLAYNMQPTKPVIDGESLYEDHPVCFNVKDLGTSSAYDVRKYAYLDVFAGAFGNTYGCHDIWQFYSSKHEASKWSACVLAGSNEFARRQSNAICTTIN